MLRVYVCACAYACWCPATRTELHLKGWFYPLFGMCVSSSGVFCWLLGPCLLYNPLLPTFLPSSYWESGTSSQKPPASHCHPCPCPLTSPPPQPDSDLLLWGVLMLVTLTWATKAGLGDTPIPMCVASCALGKVENSINFWCSGLQMWGFLLR